MYRILLICLGGIVRGRDRNDVGDIPYENQGNAVDRHVAGGILTSTSRDYGDIPYEKGIDKHRDYGDIPYEKGFPKPHKEDYGNIPYEKDLGPPGDEFDIKGKIKEILGGREIPGLTKTTGSYSVEHRDATTSPVATTSSGIARSSVPETATIRMRAKDKTDDSAWIEYESPRTIDDSDCNPKTRKCSFCSDKEGYRVYCLNGTTTKAPSDMKLLIQILVNLTRDYEDYNTPQLLNHAAFSKSIEKFYPKGWAYCPVTKSTTPTTTTTIPPHPLNSVTIAKCYVCGLANERHERIPTQNTICADSFMSHSYKKHCKYLDREGWFFNGTDDFYMWGRWTGGCSMRFVDITPIYTERSCRNRTVPPVGETYASRRLAKLEFALRRDNDACITTPHASLVPLSRGISLYSKMTVCVCSKNYCNRAERREALSIWYTTIAVGVCVLDTAKGF